MYRFGYHEALMDADRATQMGTRPMLSSYAITLDHASRIPAADQVPGGHRGYPGGSGRQ